MSGIIEVLSSEFERRFPHLPIQRTGTSFTFAAPHPALAVTLSDDGEEATVDLGTLTHLHFNPYVSALSADARAAWIEEQTLKFITALVSDQVVVWANPRGWGGTLDVESARQRSFPAGSVVCLWSRPLALPLTSGDL